ncbi:hypothetical protein B0H10DRAFT_2393685, partial [Mycena sp. CBHHK59/15]
LFESRYIAVSTQANFYNAACNYYYKAGNKQKAIQFNDLGISLMSSNNADADFPRAMARSMDIRALIEGQSGRHRDSIHYARMGQQVAQSGGRTLEELRCLVQEAAAVGNLGNLSEALDLCNTAHQLATACSLKDSVREIEILDLEAGIAFEKTEYVKSRAGYAAIMQTTQSPGYHVHAMLAVLQIDILMGCEDPDIDQKLAAAKETSAQRGWKHGSLFAEILMWVIEYSPGAVQYDAGGDSTRLEDKVEDIQRRLVYLSIPHEIPGNAPSKVMTVSDRTDSDQVIKDQENSETGQPRPESAKKGMEL